MKVFVMRSLTEAFPILVSIVLVNIVLFIFESQGNVDSVFQCLAYLENFLYLDSLFTYLEI